jgi:hypothetical protein
MLQHANHLEAEYGAGPHTISVPRLRPADGSDVSIAPPHEVCGVCACCRRVPYGCMCVAAASVCVCGVVRSGVCRHAGSGGGVCVLRTASQHSRWRGHKHAPTPTPTHPPTHPPTHTYTPPQVDDANFKKLVAIIRIAVPYTGMILSTRESPAMRDELLQVGATVCVQVCERTCAGTCTCARTPPATHRRPPPPPPPAQTHTRTHHQLGVHVSEVCDSLSAHTHTHTHTHTATATHTHTHTHTAIHTATHTHMRTRCPLPSTAHKHPLPPPFKHTQTHTHTHHRWA